jgi:glycosyltransferase involved in cell wall biosynthesis
MKTVLVTLPVHNEARMLRASFHRLASELRSAGVNYRLSIAEDGSSDATVEVIKQLQAEFPDLLVRTSPVRRGRGLALRQIWSEVDADVYAFADADLAAGPSALIRVVAAVENGAEVATGSRYCAGALVRRPPLRHLVSLAYNRLVRLAFRENIQDHQCGLKAFSREAKSQLFAMTRENSWAWDTEVLVLAQLSGMRVAEVPIEWAEYRWTRTPIRRLISDVYLHGVSLLRLKSGLRETIVSGLLARSTGFVTVPVDSVGPQGTRGGFSR